MADTAHFLYSSACRLGLAAGAVRERSWKVRFLASKGSVTSLARPPTDEHTMFAHFSPTSPRLRHPRHASRTFSPQRREPTAASSCSSLAVRARAPRGPAGVPARGRGTTGPRHVKVRTRHARLPGCVCTLGAGEREEAVVRNAMTPVASGLPRQRRRRRRRGEVCGLGWVGRRVGRGG